MRIRSLVLSAILALLCPVLAGAQERAEATYQVGRGRPERLLEKLDAADGAKAPASTKIVRVDCAHGDSIMQALSKKADELIIEISGICAEDVEVRRDHVTFRGTDPNLDGIQAVGTGDPFGSALLVRESRFISVENLKLTGGSRAGLRVENARRNISATNCRFEGNGLYGVVVLGSAVNINDSVATGNDGAGMAASENAFLICDNCSVFDNPAAGEGTGVVSSLAASVNFTNSSIQAQYAVDIEGSAFGSFRDSTLIGEDLPSGYGLSVFATDNATVLVRTSVLDGSVDIENQAQVTMVAVDQINNPVTNFVNGQAMLQTFGSTGLGATNLVGQTSISQFANSVFSSLTNLGDLSCSIGADAFCAPSVTKTSSTCGLCP